MFPRVSPLFAPLVAALTLAACGGGGDTKPESVDLGRFVRPEQVAAAPDGSVWAYWDGDVARIGPGGDKLTTQPKPLYGMDDYVQIHDLAAGDAGVWSVGSDLGDGRAYVVPESGKRVRTTIDASSLDAGESLDVASGAGRVWASRDNGDQVTIVDPGTRKTTYALVARVADVAAGGGYGWALTGASSDLDPDRGPALHRIERETGSTETFELEDDPTALTFGAGSVWILYPDKVERYGTDGSRQDEVKVDGLSADVGDIAVGGTTVWATSFDEGKLVRIDAKGDLKAAEPVAVREPRDLTATKAAGWVSQLDKPPLRAEP